MKKYPKEIFVTREEDRDDEYLLANEYVEDVNDGEVAIYTLKEVKRKRTQTVIEDPCIEVVDKEEKIEEPIRKSIGKVIHYFDKAMVMVVKLNDRIMVGDTINIEQKDGGLVQKVESMEIEHKQVLVAHKDIEVAIKVSNPVKSGAKIYKNEQ